MTSSTFTPSHNAIVTGDVMIDWLLQVDRDQTVAARSWHEAARVKRVRHFGGAWLLADLVDEFATSTPYSGRVSRIAAPERGREHEIHQTHTVIARDATEVWRVQSFLGVGPSGDGGLRLINDPADADIVAIVDSDLGFDTNRDAWPAAIKDPTRNPWVVLKTSVPAFGGGLWQHLMTRDPSRVVVVLTVDDLRRKGIPLLRRLSWERIAQDLTAAIFERPALEPLTQCGHIIVSFGSVGAWVMSGETQRSLVFDRALMEGEWEPANSDRMIGYTTTLAAAVTHELMIHPEWPQFSDAAVRAINATRKLFETGYGGGPEPKFPGTEIVEAARSSNRPVLLARVSGAAPDAAPDSWTILQDRLDAAAAISPDKSTEEVLYELAARVAVFGPEEALSDVPQLKLGKLFAVDRREIESLRTVKALLAEYVARKASKPFSIAVFGPPGSGKSFGVQQIAASIAGDRIKPLTFNLTQFTSSNDLRGAFHQVRDVALSGKIPLVFWDEFDTTYEGTELGWLRYFIGPMQDGTFQEDQITHPIGSSIFVFAGGTTETKDQFVDLAMPEKDGKGPDFVSRLKGFLNVAGPNGSGGAGVHFLRRALLLRSMIENQCSDAFRKHGKQKILSIDPAVLHAFITTPKYRHGARSLESVIAMSSLAGRKYFDSSSLPAEPQLALHVEVPFVRADELPFTYDVVRLEQLAAAAHEEFRRAREKSGWSYGSVRDDKRKVHDLLVPYDRLPETARESNRATVRWIPKKIAAVGYEMAPVGSAEPQQMTPEEIETLAEIEHEIWMERKLAAGYVLADVSTESPKQSPYLKPWAELPEDSKDIDRAFARAIPHILERAAYVLVKRKT